MEQEAEVAYGAKCFPAAKLCDCCDSAAALVFCRSDAMFMCMSCDVKVHNPNERHERVWVCEVCEQVPAVVACKADAAALCFECDRDIHSANPLARKHDRTPVVPFYDAAESFILKTTADATATVAAAAAAAGQSDFLSNIDTWGSINGAVNATKFPLDARDVKSIEFLFSDSDSLLDFENYQQISSHLFNDSVVPVQSIMNPPIPADSITQEKSPESQFEIEFARSNIKSYSNNSYTTTPSINLSVSSSSMDASVVPDVSALSEASYPISMNVNSFVDFNGNQGFLTAGMDREARVLRYREKRKNRKFQKTVRYASRKAYAETRPRIKGRFAKRTGGECDVDPVFASGSPDFMADSNYGVAMSF